MTTTFNGKEIWIEGAHLFKAGHSVKVSGAFPLTIELGATPSGSTEVSVVDGEFVISIGGVGRNQFEAITEITGCVFKGSAVEFLILTTFVGSTATDDIYRVIYSVYDV